MAWKYVCHEPGAALAASVALARDGIDKQSWSFRSFREAFDPESRAAVLGSIVRWANMHMSVVQPSEVLSFASAVADALRHVAGGSERPQEPGPKRPSASAGDGIGIGNGIGIGIGYGVYAQLVAAQGEVERLRGENGHLRSRVALLEGQAFGV
jgi:hypothetical protein